MSKKAKKLDPIDALLATAEITLHAEQDHIEVRGNAVASGDAAADKAAEDEILSRLDRGDIWAWAAVTVRATLEFELRQDIGNGCIRISDFSLSGSDHLGCCNYADEDDFRHGGYFEDMKAEALAELRGKLELLRAKLT